MKKPIVIHPFLFGVFPVLFLFSYNKARMALGEMVGPAVAVALAVGLLFFGLRAILKDKVRAGVLVSSFLLLFFSYGHFYSALADLRHRYLLPLWAVLFVLAVYYSVRTRRDLTGLSNFLNVVAVALVVISIVDVGVYTVRRDIAWSPDEVIEGMDGLPDDTGQARTLPDIYYIILDRYGSATSLREFYDYDNSAFMAYLTEKGFYVARDSKANYLKTAHSLASSLNMEYINYLGETVGEDSRDWMPLFVLLQDYKVWRFLKQRGYTFIHFGDFWHATTRNKYADINVNYYWLSEFSMLLYKTTAIFPIGVHLGIFDERREQYKRILYKFDKLAEIPSMEEPTFVFAHMLVPHSPYVFDRDGNFVTRQQQRSRPDKVGYVEQLIFTNRRVTELIDTLIASSEDPPIIILQADEGPFPPRYGDDPANFDWRDATEFELREKMRILNAYYLPGAPGDAVYPSVTPVNTFRIVFNLYFDQNLELLPDEIYAFVDIEHLYKFFSITDLLK